jgi:hypothetical protein
MNHQLTDTSKRVLIRRRMVNAKNFGSGLFHESNLYAFVTLTNERASDKLPGNTSDHERTN